MFKNPRQKEQVSSAKSPQTAVDLATGYISKTPRWRFAKLKAFNDTDFGYSDKQELMDEILDKLANFETMTWSQITNTDGGNNHWCDVSGMSKEAQKMFMRLNLYDLGPLFSLRLNGTFRIWGIINPDGTFDIVWFDPNHEIYPSRKKHT